MVWKSLQEASTPNFILEVTYEEVQLPGLMSTFQLNKPYKYEYKLEGSKHWMPLTNDKIKLPSKPYLDLQEATKTQKVVKLPLKVAMLSEPVVAKFKNVETHLACPNVVTCVSSGKHKCINLTYTYNDKVVTRSEKDFIDFIESLLCRKPKRKMCMMYITDFHKDKIEIKQDPEGEDSFVLAYDFLYDFQQVWIIDGRDRILEGIASFHSFKTFAVEKDQQTIFVADLPPYRGVFKDCQEEDTSRLQASGVTFQELFDNYIGQGLEHYKHYMNACNDSDARISHPQVINVLERIIQHSVSQIENIVKNGKRNLVDKHNQVVQTEDKDAIVKSVIQNIRGFRDLFNKEFQWEKF